MYTTLPHLDFDRLAKIHAAVAVPLVLHGGSGTAGGNLRRATSLGIAKVNVASELVNAIRQSLLDQWGARENLWVPFADAASTKALVAVVEKWLHLTGAAGRA